MFSIDEYVTSNLNVVLYKVSSYFCSFLTWLLFLFLRYKKNILETNFLPVICVANILFPICDLSFQLFYGFIWKT